MSQNTKASEMGLSEADAEQSTQISQTSYTKQQQDFRMSNRNIFDVMNMLEQEPFSVLAQEGEQVNEEDFEDITQELFTSVESELSELDLIVNYKTFNWEDVMTSFETMDPKMDQRVKRNQLFQKSKTLIEELEGLDQAPLTLSKKLALIRELLLQLATWQQKVTHLHQSIFSNLFLSRKAYYLSCPDLMPVCESILYIIHVFYMQVRCTQTFKDEDVCYPISLEPLFELEPSEMMLCLSANIERYESAAKSGDKTQDKLYKDLSKAHKLIQALLVYVMYSFHPKDFQEDVFKDIQTKQNNLSNNQNNQESEIKQQEDQNANKTTQGKKKKKGKNKKKAAQEEIDDDDLDILLEQSIYKNKAITEDLCQNQMMKFVESLQLNIFEQKQEKQADSQWARSLSEPNVFHALPLTQSRKIFQTLNFKESSQFYAKIHKQVKDLIQLRQQMSLNKINSQQMLQSLNAFMEEQPCGIMRLAYERCFYTDIADISTITLDPYRFAPELSQNNKDKKIQKDRDRNPQEYFFGHTFHEIKITDFLKPEFCELYPRALKNWDKHETFMEFLHNTCLVFRERVRRCFLNKTRQRRGFKQLFADYSILLNQAQYVDEEVKLTYEKMEFDIMVCTGMQITYQAQAIFDYMLKGFELELYCVGELSQYCGYMSHIHDFYSINRNMHVFSAAGGRDLAQRIVNLSDLKNSAERFNTTRKQLTFAQKIAVDEYEVSKAMKLIFKGMELLMAALIELKIVKDVFRQYEADEMDLEEGVAKPILGMPLRPIDSRYTAKIRENSFHQRQLYLKSLAYSKVVSFDEYVKDWQKDYGELDASAKLEQAKTDLMAGKKFLQNLQETSQEMRNGVFWTDAQLKNLQMKVVENSLVIAKIKMKMSAVAADQLKNMYYVNINYEKSCDGLPVLSVTDRKK